MIRGGALAEPVREFTIASTIQRMLHESSRRQRHRVAPDVAAGRHARHRRRHHQRRIGEAHRGRSRRCRGSRRRPPAAAGAGGAVVQPDLASGTDLDHGVVGGVGAGNEVHVQRTAFGREAPAG